MTPIQPIFLLLLFLNLITSGARANSVASHQRQSFPFEFISRHCVGMDEQFSSKILPPTTDRPSIVQYRILLPKGFRPNLHYPVVYFLHGRDGNGHIVDQLPFCDQLDQLVDQGGHGFIVVAPDGGNNYWMNGAVTHLKWGDVVTQELIEDVEKKYGAIHSQNARLIAGISMGGHGAIQLTLNHPGLYGAVAAHSPVFRTQEEASQDFPLQFGSGEDYQNRDPFSLMQLKGKRFEVPVWIDMGGADHWLKRTSEFADYLRSVGVKADLHVAEDKKAGHEMSYWMSHLHEYISWYSQHLPTPH